MRNFTLSLILSAILTLGISSCRHLSAEDVAAKIESRTELASEDYDVMLTYLEEATDAQLPQIEKANTWDDLQKIDEESQRRFPYADIFATTLLHDFPQLSSKQTERLTEMRHKTHKAAPNK